MGLSFGIIIGLSINASAQESSSIPSWLKSTAKFWGEGQISDTEFMKAMQWLIDHGYLKVSSTVTPSAQSQQSSQSSTTTSNSAINQNSDTLTNSNYNAISTNPNQYKDRWTKFSGEIITVETSGDITAVQLNLADLEFGKIVIAYFTGWDSKQFIKGDCLAIEGKIQGTVEGQNAFRATLSYPTMTGEKAAKLSCLDAKYPASRTLMGPVVQQAGNVVVTVKKVEFAEKHTRVNISIKNLNSDRKVTFYNFNSYIVDGQNQYKSQSGFLYGTNDIDSTILPGIVEQGYLFFDPAPQKPFKLLLEVNEEYQTSDFDKGINLDNLDHKMTFDLTFS